MATKKRVVEDPAEAFERLGIKNPEAPGGETSITIEGKPNEQEQEPVQAAPDTSGEQVQSVQAEPEQAEPEQAQLELGEEVVSTQDPEGNLTAEETERRSWQGEADKARAEAKVDRERYDAQIIQMQSQNRELMNTMAPFLTKYGGVQTNQPTTNAPVEPKADFVADGFFDPDKFSSYMKDHDTWVIQNAKTTIKSDLKKEQEEYSVQQQLTEVAKEFPEYVNALTGEVDTNRLYRDLQSHTSKKTVLDLLRDAKGKPAMEPVANNPLTSEASIKAIEQNANRPSSVATSPSSEVTPKEVPEGMKKITKVFGDIELPPNFDGLIEN